MTLKALLMSLLKQAFLHPSILDKPVWIERKLTDSNHPKSVLVRELKGRVGLSFRSY